MGTTSSGARPDAGPRRAGRVVPRPRTLQLVRHGPRDGWSHPGPGEATSAEVGAAGPFPPRGPAPAVAGARGLPGAGAFGRRPGPTGAVPARPGAGWYYLPHAPPRPGVGRGAVRRELARSAPMKFGVWLPSYAYRDRDPSHLRRLDDYIRRLEEAEVDIWVIDHLLRAEGLYGMSWLEPMSVLTYAAARTERVMLGTGID